MCHGKSEGQAMPAEGPWRKRGRPPKPEGPTSPKDRKAAQRARERVAKETHPDRVVIESGLLWFEVWVSSDSTTPEGRKVHTEGYRRFGEASSRTPYGLIGKLPEEYRGRAGKALESMGLLPQRTKELRHRALPRPTGPNIVPESRIGNGELADMREGAPDYADLTVTERIKEIDGLAGATGTKGEGAGQSTYEPPRTEAATVGDAAHVLRKYGTPLIVGPAASDEEITTLAAWWEDYLRPYGGGPTIPAKIVRVSQEQAAEARRRVNGLLEEYPSQASCPTCGTSPLAFHEPTLTVRCPECNTICFVSLPRGTQYVGRKRSLSPKEEEEATWAGRENR